MRQGSEMKVRLKDLPSRQTIALGPEFVRAALDGLPMRQALERPADDPDAGRADADIELYIEGTNVFARGSVGGWFEVACGRCVGPARIEFGDKVAVSYLPREQVPEDSDDGEVELTEDDLDLYPYDDQTIDLEPLLREQIILAVPYAPLCKGDCKGLCPVCGADLNTTSCACDRDVVDPRLAALKDIKL
jgi:uncharacterized protein